MKQLDMKAVQARRLVIPSNLLELRVYLIGCGGTGSWLAPHLARYLRLFKEMHPTTEVMTCFIDPDTVEEKNTFRQNFVPSEIGMNKAEALAMRYTMSAGLEIMAVSAPFGQLSFSPRYDEQAMVLYIGCVDNAAARRSIVRQLKYREHRDFRSFWLDCGNHKYGGQVLLSADGDPSVDPFALKGLCAYIPPATVFHPDLLAAEKEKKVSASKRLSCAEIAMMDQQSLSINTTVASIAAHYLAGLLLTGKVDKFETHFDLEGNLPFNHRYLVPEEFAVWTKKSGKKGK